jgi:hypothetical protein
VLVLFCFVLFCLGLGLRNVKTPFKPTVGYFNSVCRFELGGNTSELFTFETIES